MLLLIMPPFRLWLVLFPVLLAVRLLNTSSSLLVVKLLCIPKPSRVAYC